MTDWPTRLEADGTAPVLMTLLASDDVLLARQAAYLMFAGEALQNSGYEIDAFQQHLPGVTVPLVLKNAKGLPAAVYSYSEPWDPAAVAALSAWVKDLRHAGVAAHVPVIVIAQHESTAVSGLPEISQFIHMSAPQLPGDQRA